MLFVAMLKPLLLTVKADSKYPKTEAYRITVSKIRWEDIGMCAQNFESKREKEEKI